MKAVVKVKGERYERYSAGSRFAKTYKGEELAVWRKIAAAHSYHYMEDDLDVEDARKEGKTDAQIVEEIRNNVLGCNGDGCDYLHSIVENGKELWDGEEIEEDEEVDC